MDIIHSYILEPLKYEFIQRALIAIIAIGTSCGLIGTYIMLRKLSLIGDAIAHAVLPGVVIGFMVAGKSQFTLFIGALIAGILTSLFIGFVERNSKIKEDASIGIIFTGAFALGILLVSQLKGVHIDLSSYLFGDVLGISNADIILSFIIMIVIILCIVLFYKQLLITSFDPVMANIIGISPVLVHYFLMSLLSMSIVAGLQSVGVVLLVAMLITPAATAYLITDRLQIILLLASLLGITSSVIGLFLSYHLNLASGASIVLVAVIFFLIAFAFSPKEGLLTKYIRHWNWTRNILIDDVIKLLYKFRNYKLNDIIETIISEFSLSTGKARRVIKTIKRKKLIELHNGILHLTEVGRKKALHLIRTHRLWETYILKEGIGDKSDIHTDAEKVEHLLSEDLLEELDRELGYPEKDPHGTVIPKE